LTCSHPSGEIWAGGSGDGSFPSRVWLATTSPTFHGVPEDDDAGDPVMLTFDGTVADFAAADLA
jgi:hypothetical protein